MIMMQPDKNGDWVAKSNITSDNFWSFKRGDYIKIDNHHNVDISINVHYYYISEKNNNGQIEKSFVEDFRSPKVIFWLCVTCNFFEFFEYFFFFYKKIN